MPKTLVYILFSAVILVALVFVIYMGTRKVRLDDNHFVEIVFNHNDNKELGALKRTFGYNFTLIKILGMIIVVAMIGFISYSFVMYEIGSDIFMYIILAIMVIVGIYNLAEIVTTKLELYENGLVYRALFSKNICIFGSIDKLSPYVVVNQFNRIKAYGFKVVYNGKIAFSFDGRNIRDMDLLVASILSDSSKIESVTKITGSI